MFVALSALMFRSRCIHLDLPCRIDGGRGRGFWARYSRLVEEVCLSLPTRSLYDYRSARHLNHQARWWANSALARDRRKPYPRPQGRRRDGAPLHC